VATRTLSNERAGVANLYLGQRRSFERLREAVSPVTGLGRDELMRRYIEVLLLEFLAKRMIGAALAGRPPGAEGSVVKLAWSQCAQRLTNTAVDLTGDVNGSWGNAMLSARSLSIAGGTTEVNKNIIGERVLGLPKEPA
jgi:alkylation response protein AidB-like acyl-CoA dehydrogenase